MSSNERVTTIVLRRIFLASSSPDAVVEFGAGQAADGDRGLQGDDRGNASTFTQFIGNPRAEISVLSLRCAFRWIAGPGQVLAGRGWCLLCSSYSPAADGMR